MTWPFCLVVCIGAQTPPTAQTDTAPPPSARFPASWYPADDVTVTSPAPERDAPYTATVVTEGRTLDHRTDQYTVVTTSALQARDSAGRRRTESDMPARLDGHGQLVYSREVNVSDPVSHCSFRWIQPWTDPGKPTAHVTCAPRTLRYVQQNTWAGSLITAPEDKVEFGAAVHYEPLGTRLFGDIPAKGMRRTKITENSQTSGQSSTMVTESWYSEELKEIISSTAETVPGEITYKLTDIHRGDPDPALFYPPDGYAIAPELMDLRR